MNNEPPMNPDPEHLVWIQPGTFTMGSPINEVDRGSNESPQTQVTISKSFWISKYETTQEEYLSVIGTNPSLFTGDLKRPVEQVNWNDAINYCAKLTGRSRAAGRLPTGHVYRLPTEAEWEYCCRAGTTTAMAFGDSLGSSQANFNGNYPYGGADKGPYLTTTTKVGSYAPIATPVFMLRALFPTPPALSDLLHLLFPQSVEDLGRPGVGQWHNGAANMLFCDGHIEHARQEHWTAATDDARRLWNNDNEPHPETW